MDSRRDVLRKLALSVTAAGVAGTAQASTLRGDAASPVPAKHRVPGDPARVEATAAVVVEPTAPLTLVAPFGPGETIAPGWLLSYVEPMQHGAVVLGVASIEGPLARVHVCRNDGQPRGIAHTPAFDLILMNGGDGGTPSQEQLGRVLLGLANVLTGNTDAALAAHPELSRLLTHDERVARFGQQDSEILT